MPNAFFKKSNIAISIALLLGSTSTAMATPIYKCPRVFIGKEAVTHSKFNKHYESILKTISKEKEFNYNEISKLFASTKSYEEFYAAFELVKKLLINNDFILVPKALSEFSFSAKYSNLEFEKTNKQYEELYRLLNSIDISTSKHLKRKWWLATLEFRLFLEEQLKLISPFNTPHSFSKYLNRISNLDRIPDNFAEGDMSFPPNLAYSFSGESYATKRAMKQMVLSNLNWAKSLKYNFLGPSKIRNLQFIYQSFSFQQQIQTFKKYTQGKTFEVEFLESLKRDLFEDKQIGNYDAKIVIEASKIIKKNFEDFLQKKEDSFLIYGSFPSFFADFGTKRASSDIDLIISPSIRNRERVKLNQNSIIDLIKSNNFEDANFVKAWRATQLELRTLLGIKYDALSIEGGPNSDLPFYKLNKTPMDFYKKFSAVSPMGILINKNGMKFLFRSEFEEKVVAKAITSEE